VAGKITADLNSDLESVFCLAEVLTRNSMLPGTPLGPDTAGRSKPLGFDLLGFLAGLPLLPAEFYLKNRGSLPSVSAVDTVQGRAPSQ
jgi:hypothetical protein